MRPRLYQLFVLAHHALTKRVESVARAELGLSGAQLGTLLVLSKSDGCMLTELATALTVNKSAITKLAENLELAGMIERRACDRDGRSSRVWLTARGKAAIERGRPFEERMTKKMT